MSKPRQTPAVQETYCHVTAEGLLETVYCMPTVMRLVHEYVVEDSFPDWGLPGRAQIIKSWPHTQQLVITRLMRGGGSPLQHQFNTLQGASLPRFMLSTTPWHNYVA